MMESSSLQSSISLTCIKRKINYGPRGAPSEVLGHQFVTKYYIYLPQTLNLLHSFNNQWQNVIKSCISGLHNKYTLLGSKLYVQDPRTSPGRGEVTFRCVGIAIYSYQETAISQGFLRVNICLSGCGRASWAQK